jgi:hypothetical protein
MFHDILLAQHREWQALLGEPHTILFDEIQNVQGWEIVVNRLRRSVGPMPRSGAFPRSCSSPSTGVATCARSSRP